MVCGFFFGVCDYFDIYECVGLVMLCSVFVYNVYLNECEFGVLVV